MDELLKIMAQLRDPTRGCPWDREQNWQSLAKHTIEEAYEVAEAAERGDAQHLKEELGDLLLQVVFYSQIAAETGAFNFTDVVATLNDKLIRRHPHVFGDDTSIKTTADQNHAWEAMKAQENAAKTKQATDPANLLDSISPAMPALSRALKLQKSAAKIGFNWQNIEQIISKLDEEVAEVKAVLAETPPDRDKLMDEFGDVLCVMVNLFRHFDMDPETVMRANNQKYAARFKAMVQHLQNQQIDPTAATLDQMTAAWKAIK